MSRNVYCFLLGLCSSLKKTAQDQELYILLFVDKNLIKDKQIHKYFTKPHLNILKLITIEKIQNKKNLIFSVEISCIHFKIIIKRQNALYSAVTEEHNTRKFIKHKTRMFKFIIIIFYYTQMFSKQEFFSEKNICQVSEKGRSVLKLYFILLYLVVC